MITEPIIAPLKDAGKHALCTRCGQECRVAPETNLAARPMRLGNVGGVCANCGLTAFLKSEEYIALDQILPDGYTPADALRATQVQELVLRVMVVGQTGLRPEEIDWEKVIANWDLPVKKTRRKRR